MKTIGIIICSFLAVAAYIMSGFQFKKKGILLNNAYLYAAKEERKKMDKKPYYQQSCIIFSLIGTIFVLNVVQIITEWEWLFGFVIAMIVITIIYAIVSSIQIEKKK